MSIDRYIFLLKLIFKIPIFIVNRENSVNLFIWMHLRFSFRKNDEPVGYLLFIRISSPFRERWVGGSTYFPKEKISIGKCDGTRIFACYANIHKRKRVFPLGENSKKPQSGFFTAWKPRRNLSMTEAPEKAKGVSI